LQQRLETHWVGRALISAFLLVTLASILVTNLTESRLKYDLSLRSQPYLQALGLDQGWGVFAPDPRRHVSYLSAKVKYADGSTGTWDPPRGGPLVGVYWDNRWRKWEEFAVSDQLRGLWQPAALYVARQENRPGRRPVEVTLVRRLAVLFPPGTPTPRAPFEEQPYYRLKVTRDMLGGSA